MLLQDVNVNLACGLFFAFAELSFSYNPADLNAIFNHEIPDET